MERIEKTCINCPIGCNLIITKDDTAPSGYSIEGYSCRRGKEYGIKEITEPDRIITGTVRIKNSHISRLPIKTNKPVPNDKIAECLKALDSIEVSAPVKKGDIIFKNLLDMNIDLIALRKA